MPSVRPLLSVFSVSLIVTILASTSGLAVKAAADGSIFLDVGASTEYKTAIKSLKDSKIVEGYPDGSFKPKSQINRAEFLTIILRAIGSTGASSATSCFTDVQGSAWYAKAVCKAKADGIVHGYPDGMFKPDRPISFVEASKILSLAYRQKIEQSGEWYEAYVKALESSKAIPPTITALDKLLTRAEMAEMIWRMKEGKTDQPAKGFLNVKHPKLTVNFASDSPQTARSCADLQVLATEPQSGGGLKGLEMMEDVSMPSRGAQTPMMSQEATSVDFSQTNVQVEGVDEADIVKTDGTYLYVLSQGNVRIVLARPATSLKEVSAITYADQEFTPQDLYVDGTTLVVIGTSSKSVPAPAPMPRPATDPPNVAPGVESRMMIMPPWGWYARTQVRLYSIADKEKPTLTRTLTFDGSSVESRRIADKLYLVLNHPLHWYGYGDPIPLKEEALLPRFSDSAKGIPEEKPIGVARCADVTILPRIPSPEYLIVASIPLGSANAEVKREVIVGSAANVYASLNNLYVTAPEWRYVWDGSGGGTSQTRIYRFAFEGDGVALKAKGAVNGTVLNQFSMDEHEKTLRIATTIDRDWSSESSVGSSALTILDLELKQLGVIDGIAPGERIYSVRFVGGRAYMVTFKNVDPLFVIDTSNPRSPKILGKLKIPGYSTYLHPYDETHLIGFGKEAVEAKEGDFAWYQGMKIALFDVSDVEHPKEMANEVIGDRGTDSPLLTNHRALLFDRERNLLAFPVTVYRIPESQKGEPSAYGEPVFQGAYVYDLSLDSGFKLRGTITHYDADAFAKVGDYFYGDLRSIERILRIGESLLTVSQAQLQGHSLSDLSFEGTVEFPETLRQYPGFIDERM